jgi:formiminotetrahydrofolate cyclodeaminase
VPTLDDWLEELASAAPAPGGGAAGAVNAAIGAALVSMVCRLTMGKPQFAAVEDEMAEVLGRADALRLECLAAAAEDAVAFDAVMAAYRLPKADDEQRTARSEAIQRALLGAADVPLRAGALAAEVIGLADRIEGGANPNVVSDVAAGAASARAGLETAVVNVEVNVASLADPAQRNRLIARLDELRPALGQADDVVARVRQRLT